MRLATRKLLDRAFSGGGFFAIVLMVAALFVILVPVIVKGATSVVFRATVGHRKLMVERFGKGDRSALARELEIVAQARAPLYAILDEFKQELALMPSEARRPYVAKVRELETLLRDLLGPAPGEPLPVLPRYQYGQTRWDQAQKKLKEILFVQGYDYSDPRRMGKLVLTPRRELFEGTRLVALFDYLEAHAEEMLRPRWTVYWRFFTLPSIDAHFFGGIWPEILGTFYLTVGAILFAVPFGVGAAIYLVEYAKEGPVVQALRTCISSLAGVPSIVFGLFGLSFLINTLHVSTSKSVLAGAITLALLVLPTVIRASEEAIRAVPTTYREASMSLGASKWKTVVSVVLPAALPGILTSVVISMGRAAGETAPIIFTAAVSVGKPLKLWETLSKPTPALPWNIYNLATEHEAVDQIRHVQYGMVVTLVTLVLLLNATAIVLRARLARKLRG